jgi:hypothetical protein
VAFDAWDEGEAAGRRRRGLILAGIVLVLGVPLTVGTWLSERNVDRRADDMAEDLRIAGRLVGDVDALAVDERAFPWAGEGPSPLAQALGHGDSFAGAAFGDDAISAVYSVRWGLAARCVHLLVRDDEVRTDVTDSTSCEPRSP